MRRLGLVSCSSLGKKKSEEEGEAEERGGVPTEAHDGGVDGVATVEEEPNEP